MAGAWGAQDRLGWPGSGLVVVVMMGVALSPKPGRTSKIRALEGRVSIQGWERLSVMQINVSLDVRDSMNLENRRSFRDVAAVRKSCPSA